VQSIISLVIKSCAVTVRLLPAPLALGTGRFCGLLMYWFDRKHRGVAYQNLKYAFAADRTLEEIRSLTRRYFMNLGVNFVEFLRQPMLTPEGLGRIVTMDGVDAVGEGLKQGRGAVAMTMHYGNWELSPLALSSAGYAQSVMFKPQESATAFNSIMTSCRKEAYENFKNIRQYEKGIGAVGLVRALRRNEVAGVLADQGGRTGVPVRFFGRRANFSGGGIRMAMRMGSPVYLGVAERIAGEYHRIRVTPFELAPETGDKGMDLQEAVQRVADYFEQIIRQRPEQYMWMYKIWKYDPSRNILILDDGRVGHLRQSQSVASAVAQEVRRQGGEATEETVKVVYKNRLTKAIVMASAQGSRFFPAELRLLILRLCLASGTYQALCRRKADVVISTGSGNAPVNHLISREHQARSIGILHQGLLSYARFDMVFLPEHDRAADETYSGNVVFTKGAPNLITDEYLQTHSDLLVKRYSHLKLRSKLLIGLLLGGDTKDYILDEMQSRILIHQVKEAAEQLDAHILVTTSRRTSAGVAHLVVREFRKYSRCQFLVIANRMDIPEALGGILALSDVLVVTGDSISMVSEAASSGKKTVVVPIKKRSEQIDDHKHHRFVDRLNEEGYILCSSPGMLSQALFNVAKNKIWTRRLDDSRVIRDSVRTIV